MFIDENTSRADLIKAVDENLNDVIDAFIDADVDPHKPETPRVDCLDRRRRRMCKLLK